MASPNPAHRQLNIKGADFKKREREREREREA
jgi:hypothetical protein